MASKLSKYLVNDGMRRKTILKYVDASHFHVIRNKLAKIRKCGFMHCLMSIIFVDEKMGVGIRELSTVATVLELYLCCGMIFGWANVVKVFKGEGFFSLSCGNDEEDGDVFQPIEVNLSSPASSDAATDTKCDVEKGQNGALTDVFVMASTLFSVMALFTGVIYDKYGSTITRHLGASIFVVGNVFLFIAKPGKTDRLEMTNICLHCAENGNLSTRKLKLRTKFPGKRFSN